MTGNELIQIAAYAAALLLCVKPLGAYMAGVYEGRMAWAREGWLYRLAGVDADASMTSRAYAAAFLTFNAVGLLAVYALLRLQHLLPWNPQAFPAVEPHTAFNVAVSFATNTNWQNYGGETTLSYFTQMAGLTVQNFVSAASGMAVLAALARGLASRNTDKIGNFWVDLIRGVVYILIPYPSLSRSCWFLRASSRILSRISPLRTRRYCCRWGRPHHRLRSSNSAQTGAASSTSIQPTRMKTLRRFPTSPRCWLCS